MNSFDQWLQKHLGLIRLGLFMLVGLNLFSAYRMFPLSRLLAFTHVIVAVVLLLGAVLIR